MRAIFKIDYDQDIRLLKHRGYWFSYGALLFVMLLLPLIVGPYLQSQIVFVFIYSIVGVGLLILAGFTGQVSLGHAAFLAIGAYTAGYMQHLGVPFVVYLPLSVLLSGAVGALVGAPALRLSGIYLVIATIAFGFIVEEVAARWESVTNGNEGMRIKALDLLGFTISRDGAAFYYLCFGLLIVVMLAALNILRAPTGRAFVAIRDSETAAKSLGINLAVYKVMAFSISAGMTGLAGCLYAHKAVIHQSRNVHALAVARVHYRYHHRWDRQSARRRAWLDLRRHGRSMLDAVERRLSTDGRRARTSTGSVGERRELDRGDAGKVGRGRRT